MTVQILNSKTFDPNGRIAIIGYSAINALGTETTSYLTRTGRFEQALREYSRIMQLTEPRNGALFARRIVTPAGLKDAPDVLREKPLTDQQIVTLYRDYIDRDIGIRIPRPEDNEEGIDFQNFKYWPSEKLNKDTEINGTIYPKGHEIRLPHYEKFPVSHAGIIPAGWDLLNELGYSEDPLMLGGRGPLMGRLHLMMIRMLASALLMTGVSFEELTHGIDPEFRGVAGGPGMAAGKFVRDGMANPVLKEPIRKDQLAWYLADNPAFWLVKILNARWASTRVAACNTGTCNAEDMVDRMRAGKILMGAIATCESAVNETSIIAFNKQSALANDRNVALLNDHPSLVSMPGLKARSGFTIAEGGGLLLVMDMPLALQKGLLIYGELLAARTAVGAYESADPAAPTKGVKIALQRAAADAARLDGISTNQFVNSIDFWIGHGTSTPAGDINGIQSYDEFLSENGRDPRRPLTVLYDKGGPRIDHIASARQVGAGGKGHTLGGAATGAAVEGVQIHEEGILPPSVSALGDVDPKILESRHIIYTTEPVRADAEVGGAEAEGFGDSNGLILTRKYRSDRYKGGREIESQQAERLAQRDEWISDIQSGKKRLGQFLPPFTKEK